MNAFSTASKIILTAAVLAAMLGACKKTDTTVVVPPAETTAPTSTSGTSGTTGTTGAGTTTAAG